MQLDVIQASVRRPWYADGLHFTCTQCGNCCTGGPGYVWISSVEIDRLAAFLKLARRQVIEQYCRRVGGRYNLNEIRTPQEKYDCVFLKEIPIEPAEAAKPEHDAVPQMRRICTIYSVRPLQCRTWPFWEGNLASRENWERSAHRCPGMNAGRQHSQAQMEKLRDAEDWPDGEVGSRK